MSVSFACSSQSFQLHLLKPVAVRAYRFGAASTYALLPLQTSLEVQGQFYLSGLARGLARRRIQSTQALTSCPQFLSSAASLERSRQPLWLSNMQGPPPDQASLISDCRCNMLLVFFHSFSACSPDTGPLNR